MFPFPDLSNFVCAENFIKEACLEVYLSDFRSIYGEDD